MIRLLVAISWLFAGRHSTPEEQRLMDLLAEKEDLLFQRKHEIAMLESELAICRQQIASLAEVVERDRKRVLAEGATAQYYRVMVERGPGQ